MFSKEGSTPFIPHGGHPGGKSEGSEGATPLPSNLKKHIKTCVILRIRLTDIDPIAPGHATYAYKASVKSTFSMYGIYNVKVNVRGEVQKSL